jgi:hypothetical protein
MGKEMVFFFKAVFFGLAAIILIPKEHYKKYFIYGLFFGAILEIFMVGVLSGLFHWFQYKNMGPFNVFNLFSFWTPLAWMFTLMVFLYCLPARRLFLFLYIPSFGLFGYMVGIVLQNFGLFEYLGIYKYIAPVVFTGWFAVAAWAYIKTEKITLR